MDIIHILVLFLLKFHFLNGSDNSILNSQLVKSLVLLDFRLLVRDSNWQIVDVYNHTIPGVLITSHIILTNYVPNVQILFDISKYKKRNMHFISDNHARVGFLGNTTTTKDWLHNVKVLTSFNIDYEYHQNPNYMEELKEDSFRVQLAMVVLSQYLHVDGKSINIAPLTEYDIDYMRNTANSCHILGWNPKQQDIGSAFKIEVMLLPKRTCDKFGRMFFNSPCCSAVDKTIDICRQVRGGEPVICGNSLVGIIRTVNCDRFDGIVVFTNLYLYLDWIYESINMYELYPFYKSGNVTYANQMKWHFIMLNVIVTISIVIRKKIAL